jgi:hypothetical protein
MVMFKRGYRWIFGEPVVLLALFFYAIGFLAFLITIIIWGYQGIGYVNHGSWTKFMIGNLVQWVSYDGYMKLTIYSPEQWPQLSPEDWLTLNRIVKWVFRIPVSLITFILGVIGWGLAAAADKGDRFRDRHGHPRN